MKNIGLVIGILFGVAVGHFTYRQFGFIPSLIGLLVFAIIAFFALDWFLTRKYKKQRQVVKKDNVKKPSNHELDFKRIILRQNHLSMIKLWTSDDPMVIVEKLRIRNSSSTDLFQDTEMKLLMTSREIEKYEKNLYRIRSLFEMIEDEEESEDTKRTLRKIQGLS